MSTEQLECMTLHNELIDRAFAVRDAARDMGLPTTPAMDAYLLACVIDVDCPSSYRKLVEGPLIESFDREVCEVIQNYTLPLFQVKAAFNIAVLALDLALRHWISALPADTPSTDPPPPVYEVHCFGASKCHGTTIRIFSSQRKRPYFAVGDAAAPASQQRMVRDAAQSVVQDAAAHMA